MIKTVEAVIDEQWNVTLIEPIRPWTARRALVTILEESHAELLERLATLGRETRANAELAGRDVGIDQHAESAVFAFLQGSGQSMVIR